jgi:four helix bundle protein
MNSYRDLEIYKESKRLALEVHKITLGLPKFECYEEGSQLRRSSKSICASIVEGYGRRRYRGDFIRYLIISHAECDETILHLDFIYETHSFKDWDLYNLLKNEYEILSKKINRFINWVQESDVKSQGPN